MLTLCMVLSQYRVTIVWDGNNKAWVNNGVARHKRYLGDHFHSLNRVDSWCSISSVLDWTTSWFFSSPGSCYTQNSEYWRNCEMWQSWKIGGTYLLHNTQFRAHIISCLGTLHLRRTWRMQYVIGIQIWHLCKNYAKNLVPDSNAEELSHQQNFKTWKFWNLFPCEDIKTLVPIQNFRT